MSDTKCTTSDRKTCEMENDLLDRMLDGEPMMIVPSPGLRRALRRRVAERVAEERQDLDAIQRRYWRG